MVTVRGIVVDNNCAPLQDVNVIVSDSIGNYANTNGVKIGRSTDQRGSFILPVANENDFVTFSFIGKKSLTIPAVAAAKKSKFKLTEDAKELDESVISTPRSTPRATPRTTPVAEEINNKEAKKSIRKIIFISAFVCAIAVAGLLYYFMKKK